ncbi:phosphatidate cytidylyltransferase [Balneola sp. MJW-20]|uniref:phosphatidate cytidylyltransferase n=1 Tax=Gracilimonas aurantiaca TaxID=3234185 RepID=UPI00346511AD
MNELLKRVLFAVPAAAIFLYLTWLGEWYFNSVVILIGLFIVQELMRLLDKAGSPADPYFPYTIGMWIMLFPVLSYRFEILIVIFLLFAVVQTFTQTEDAIDRLSSTFFAGAYSSFGLLSLMLVRSVSDNETGFFLTVSILLMVWGTDIFAYFGGKTFGKHKLAPEISPNKTWEGFFSGFIGSFIGLGIMFLIHPEQAPLPLAFCVPWIVLVASLGPVGDLLESKIKRKAGVKDSSHILPGHGGFFDRFDALLLAAPASYLFLKFMEIMGYVSF